MGLFKKNQTRDGIIVNDVNTVFVSSLVGIDTNSGIRNSPISTASKMSTLIDYTRNIGLFEGSFTENFSFLNIDWSVSIIGNNKESKFLGNVSLSCTTDSSEIKIYDMTFSVLSVLLGARNMRVSIVNNFISSLSCVAYSIIQIITNNFIIDYNIYKGGGSGSLFICKNNTIFNLKNYLSYSGTNTLDACIFLNSIDLYNYSTRDSIADIPSFRNCLFRKAIVWKWNGAIIPVNYGTYGNAVGDYLADVISAMYAYTNTIVAGTDRTYFSAMFPNANTSPIFYVDQNGQTCKVVEDRPSVAGSKKIFNRYVGDNPVDYSLFLHADNIALTMSNELSYVGCYKANADVLTFGDVINVNPDGSDDLVTPADMLIYDGNGKFRVSIDDSVQIRNRVRSSVFHFKRGFTLDGFQSQMKSGLSSRFSLGKFQPYNITDSPTLPQESIEVIAYDDAVTPSAFPRFSAMFNDKVQMWYHTAGVKKDLPVLFNDLLAYFAIVTDKSLAEYGAWAVTNADYETFALSTKANVKLQNVPVYFAQVEINLNYHV